MIWKQDSFWLKMIQGYKKREIEKNIAAVKQFAEVSLQKGISKQSLLQGHDFRIGKSQYLVHFMCVCV